MVVDTQFHKFFYGRPFARVLHVFLVKDIVGDSPVCYQGQQDDLTRTTERLPITILRKDTI